MDLDWVRGHAVMLHSGSIPERRRVLGLSSTGMNGLPGPVYVHGYTGGHSLQSLDGLVELNAEVGNYWCGVGVG